MKTKIIISIIIILMTIISYMFFKSNLSLKKQLEEKNNIILKIEKEYSNNINDMIKMNQEIQNYQQKTKDLSQKIKNIESDCLHTCKIPNDLKNILK